MNFKKIKITAAIFMTAFISFSIFDIHSAAADKPKLLTLYVQEASGGYDTARLTFSSSHAGVCYIYRKASGGSYTQSTPQAAIHPIPIKSSLKRANMYIQSARRDSASVETP